MWATLATRSGCVSAASQARVQAAECPTTMGFPDAESTAASTAVTWSSSVADADGAKPGHASSTATTMIVKGGWPCW
jgi:hypothetical protein